MENGFQHILLPAVNGALVPGYLVECNRCFSFARRHFCKCDLAEAGRHFQIHQEFSFAFSLFIFEGGHVMPH